MLDISIETPSSMMEKLKKRYKQKRLEFDLTQEGLATKSSVSLGSLKRFESTGKISLESLLKLSLVLECLEDFQALVSTKVHSISSIDELLEQKQVIKKRGTKK
jgi:transcriptional regulator with XRE-family HTH domain